MVLLFARTAAPEPPVVPEWGRLRVDWIGWDGSIWPLVDYSTGLCLISDGVEGLHFPEITEQTSKSRAIPGDRQRGWQAEARDVFWPLLVWASDTDGWLDRQAEFMRTIHPDVKRAGTWRVTAGSQVRELTLTGVLKGGYQYSIDPLQHGWAVYPITLKAHDPYWRGDVITAGPWKAHSAASFFPGPPFHIGSSATLTSAKITNPCPVDLWPVWHLQDALADVHLGISGRTIILPFDLVDGDVLDIDTDPRHPAATLNGTDVLELLGLQAYAPVPAFETSSLSITASGTGSVSCSIQELWFTAF